MFSVAVDMTGLRFGKLTAVRKVGSRNGNATWLCLCDCGTETIVQRPNLKSGHTSSCGCAPNAGNYRHGHATTDRLTAEYRIWAGMLQRCGNKKAASWKYYGGRGIVVCARWQEGFANFIADMGTRPSPEHSIDRIDNDGNYEPSNCRWATKKEQSNNRRPWGTARDRAA